MKAINGLGLAKELKKTPMTRKQMSSRFNLTMSDVAALLAYLRRIRRYDLVCTSDGVYSVTNIRKAKRGTPLSIRTEAMHNNGYDQRTTKAPKINKAPL